MSKVSASLITAMLLAMYLTTACAEQGNGTDTAEQAQATAGQPAGSEATEGAAEEEASLMDQPVDFSTPEKVEETLQNIREQEGEGSYKAVMSAMEYLLFYDLSVRRDKELLHKKLNGRTPKQIIGMMRR